MRRLVAGQRQSRLRALAAGLDARLPVVQRLRPGASWERVTAAVNAALPASCPAFTRDRLVRAVRLLAAEGLVEPALLAPTRGRGRAPERASVQAAEAVARYLRGHRREAAERGVAERYRPPTLAQVARYLAEDAGLRPPSGGAWAPSSVKALVDRAQGASGLAALARPHSRQPPTPGPASPSGGRGPPSVEG